MSADPPGVRLAGVGDEAGSALATQLDALDRLGWNGIELRTVDGAALADLDDARFARVAGTLRERRVRVVGVASRIGGWSRSIAGDVTEDLRELDVLAQRCRTLGTRYIRIMSYPNAGLDERDWQDRAVARIRLLARRAQDAGVVLLHENCVGWAGASAGAMLRLLERVDSPALGLLFDTGNGAAHGYDAYDLLARVVEHVVHVHVKDAVHTPDGPRYVPPGAGSARVAECLRLLLARGYTGVWSLEPHVSLRPHATDAGGRGEPDADAYVACGRALERLVREEVLPSCPDWRAVAGSLFLNKSLIKAAQPGPAGAPATVPPDGRDTGAAAATAVSR